MELVTFKFIITEDVTIYETSLMDFSCFRINYSLIYESVKVNALFRLKPAVIRCQALNIHGNSAPRNEGSIRQSIVFPGITSVHCQ
jgi:hypothetical protein